MLISYLKISVRNAIKEWQYTLINLLGLAIGIATFVFIVRYIELENNIDQFHSDKERIYKLYSDLKWNASEAQFSNTPPALGTALLADIPEVKIVTRLRRYYSTPIRVEDKLFLEPELRAVDSSFLAVFDFKVIEGDADGLFTDPNEVVLAESYARKYFGDESPIGKRIMVNDKLRQVSAVIENPRPDSHFNYTILVSLSADEAVEYFEWSWLWSNVDTYIKIHQDTDIEIIEAKLDKLVQDNAGPSIERITGSSLESFFAAGNQLKYYPVSLNEVYYDSMNLLGPSGNRTYLKIFGLIATLLISLAIINYINLSTARATRRVREVGVRKVVGSTRRVIISQFLIEGFLLTLVASIVSLALISLLNPVIQVAFNIRWNMNPFESVEMLKLLVYTTIFTAFLSSIYPAIHISSIVPTESLKSNSSNKAKLGGLRKFLVIIQFITSFSIIIIAYTASQQLDYLKNRSLGFDKEQLLVIDNAYLVEQQASFKNSVLSQSFVSNASYTSHIPGMGGNFEVFKKIGAWDQDYMAYLLDVDEDFFETFGIKLLAGEGFSAEERILNKTNVVINERAVRNFELEDPIGSKIMALDNGGELTVSGIMDEVNFFMSSREPAESVIRPHNDSLAVFPLYYLTVRLNTDNTQNAIEKLSKIWDQQNIGIELQYSFFDEIFDKNFKKENQMSEMMQLFSALTIFIAILGLIGLVSYNTNQAKKMIGIRKVHGAGILAICRLLMLDFLKLIFLAFVIAVPVANYFIEDWLEQFVYRMEISPMHFVIPGLFIIILAMLATGYQSYRASAANPIDAIKDE